MPPHQDGRTTGSTSASPAQGSLFPSRQKHAELDEVAQLATFAAREGNADRPAAYPAVYDAPIDDYFVDEAKRQEMLKEIVCEACKERVGWGEDITPTDITLTTLTGYGGSVTYKAFHTKNTTEAAAATPAAAGSEARSSGADSGADSSTRGPSSPLELLWYLSKTAVASKGGNTKVQETAVLLKVIHKRFAFSNQPEFVPRVNTMGAVLYEHGVGPQPIASHKDKWFIQSFVDETADRSSHASFPAVFGTALAKVHSIDTAWYEPFRASYTSRFPILSEAPANSALWYSCTRKCWVNDSRPDWAFRAFADSEIQAATAAGARAVTTHGDPHKGNFLWKRGRGADEPRGGGFASSELLFVDNEQSCVAAAVWDMAYAAQAGVFGDQAGMLAFCVAYLKAAGFPSGTKDAAALALDIERYKLCGGFFARLPQFFEGCSKKDDAATALSMLEGYLKLKKVADDALTNPELADQIVQNGFWEAPCVRQVLEDPALTFCGKSHDLDTPFTIHKVASEADAVAGGAGLVVNEDGTLRPLAAPGYLRAALGKASTNGNVVVSRQSNLKNRLVLSKEALAALPPTGDALPTSAPLRLLLRGAHAGKGLGWKASGNHEGNEYGDFYVCDAAAAITVHFEKCGAIRLASMPHIAFDVEHGKLADGNRVGSWVFQNDQQHRFMLHADGDGTISTVNNPDLVLAIADTGNQIKLCSKSKPNGKQSSLLAFDFPAGTGREAGADGDAAAETKLQSTAAAIAEQLQHQKPVKLTLDSHPGKGIVLAPFHRSALPLKMAASYDDDALPSHSLAVGPAADAIEVTVLPLFEGGNSFVLAPSQKRHSGNRAGESEAVFLVAPSLPKRKSTSSEQEE